jgi:hypothetical protein
MAGPNGRVGHNPVSGRSTNRSAPQQGAPQQGQLLDPGRLNEIERQLREAQRRIDESRAKLDKALQRRLA